MANYIDKEIICEAYIHLETDELSPSELEAIKLTIKRFFDARVAFLLGEEVQTNIETSEGSLIVKLTAYAGIVALLGGSILKYPEFRSSVKMIYEDSRMLAEATNLETVFVTRTPSCNRLHSEARTGVFGRTAKLLTAIDTLKSKADGLKAPATRSDVRVLDEIANSVTLLGDQARILLMKVVNDEDRFCLAMGFHEAFKQLPETLAAENELRQSPMKKALLKDNNQDILAASTFQKYSAAVKLAKNNLKTIGVASKPQKS